MGKKDVNMLSGSILKGVFVIAIPIMVMNVLQSLFNIIDMTILKTYDTDGGIAVGAVGACGQLITLITGLVIGVSTGANVIIAKNIGRNDRDSINRSVGTSLAFSLVSGLVLAAIGICFASVFLQWVNCPEVLLPQATLYFRLYFAGIPLFMVYNFCASILRSTGDSRSPMVFLTIGGAVKVALTFLLIGKYRLGVMGVAIATIISWGVSTTLGLLALHKSQGPVTLSIRNIRFYKAELRQILRIGVPDGIQRGLYSVANVIIASTVNSFGAQATTGISIANNYDGIMYQICTAASLAVMPYVSQNIGSGNVKRAMQAVWKGMLITIALGATFGALSAVFSGQLSSIMSSDPVVIAYSQQKMVLISSTYFICGINDILGAALRGMGKPVASTVTTLLYMCAFRFVWVYLIFPLYPNLTFLYLVWPIGWILSIITLLFIFFPTAKKLRDTHSQTALPAEN